MEGLDVVACEVGDTASVDAAFTAAEEILAVAAAQDATRVVIGIRQRSAVGIEKKAVLLGMGDKFELWSEQAHHAQIRQTLGDADLGEDLLDLAL